MLDYRGGAIPGPGGDGHRERRMWWANSHCRQVNSILCRIPSDTPVICRAHHCNAANASMGTTLGCKLLPSTTRNSVSRCISPSTSFLQPAAQNKNRLPSLTRTNALPTSEKSRSSRNQPQQALAYVDRQLEHHLLVDASPPALPARGLGVT